MHPALRAVGTQKTERLTFQDYHRASLGINALKRTALPAPPMARFR